MRSWPDVVGVSPCVLREADEGDMVETLRLMDKGAEVVLVEDMELRAEATTGGGTGGGRTG
jgi:hypothetical protein